MSTLVKLCSWCRASPARAGQRTCVGCHRWLEGQRRKQQRKLKKAEQQFVALMDRQKFLPLQSEAISITLYQGNTGI